MTPLVSLCIPTFRRAMHLRETIQSALAQSCDDFEVVIVDDCSPDETADVVATFRDSRLRYVRNPQNLGVPANYNRTMALARGEFLLLLEDHDVLEPTYIEKTVGVMRRHPSVGLVATGMVTIDAAGSRREQYAGNFQERTNGTDLLYYLLTRHDCPFSITALFRRSVVSDIAPLFDHRYWWYADLNLWMQIARRADFGYVREKLLRFRLREQGHYLAEREWESLVCIDKLHRDNWSLLFPSSGPRSALGWMLFQRAKIREILYMKMRKRADGSPWTDADNASLDKYLPWSARLLVQSVDLLPRSLLTRVRQASRQRYKYRAPKPSDLAN